MKPHKTKFQATLTKNHAIPTKFQASRTNIYQILRNTNFMQSRQNIGQSWPNIRQYRQKYQEILAKYWAIPAKYPTIPAKCQASIFDGFELALFLPPSIHKVTNVCKVGANSGQLLETSGTLVSHRLLLRTFYSSISNYKMPETD